MTRIVEPTLSGRHGGPRRVQRGTGRPPHPNPLPRWGEGTRRAHDVDLFALGIAEWGRLFGGMTEGYATPPI